MAQDPNAQYTYDPQTGTYKQAVEPTKIGNVDVNGQYVRYSDGSIRNATTGQSMTQGQYNDMMNSQEMAKKGFNPDGSKMLKQFDSMIDPTTGLLKGPYNLNAGDYQYDPTKLDAGSMEGYQALKGEALRTGPSTWAQYAQNKNKLDTQDLKDRAVTQAATSGNAAYNNLAMQGGARSGAANRIGYNMGSALLMAKQNAQRTGMGQDLSILSTDEQNRLANLGKFQGAELDINKYNTGLSNDAQLKNLSAKSDIAKYNMQNALTEVGQQRDWDKLDYTEYNKKWAAGKQADATARSGGGGGGGCCFIFLEARYGNGTMDKVVRRFRDENMTVQNRRGYYKVSEVLVPLMRKSKLIKLLVRVSMTSPLVAYGKAFYGEGSRLGLVLKPVVNFWLKTFNYLGGEHPFIRENGETI
jgi:hypothetical protein